jgi:NDP-sugar pyrophosphorylase family protein
VHRAAILAAGEGSRLAQSGIGAPKPLVDVRGEPMIVRLARQIRDTGARETIALVHPRAAEAVRLLAEAHLDVRVRCETTPGSFHSLCALLPALTGEPFLLCLVDSVLETSELSRFTRAAAESRAVALIGVTSFVQDEAPLRVLVGADGRVAAIGTPEAAPSPWVTGGVYWFGEGVAERVAEARASGVLRLRHFLSRLVEAGLDVRAHDLGRVVDVDTAEDVALLAAPGPGSR